MSTLQPDAEHFEVWAAVVASGLLVPWLVAPGLLYWDEKKGKVMPFDVALP